MMPTAFVKTRWRRVLLRRFVPSRAIATLAVIWTIALVTVILVSVQATAFRQAAGGREAVARVRAYWAARAGIEAQIAKLTANTVQPDTSNAFTINADLASVASGSVAGASFRVQHSDDAGQLVDGPLDAHTRLNVNILSAADLIALDSMDESTAQSIVNWVEGSLSEDAASGADSGAYRGLRYPYLPRSGAFRTLKELELVVGVSPDFLRGEDANYNNILDPNEDDGPLSPPNDSSDRVLDQGWSRYLTAVSELGGTTPTGGKRLDLRSASSDQIVTRVKVDQAQAQTIADHVKAGGTMPDFIRLPLAALVQSSGSSGGGTTQLTPNVRALSVDQQRTLLDECSDGTEANFPRAGRLNINTVSRQVLERLLSVEPAIIDAILLDRDGRSTGYASMLDLLQIPGIDEGELAVLMAVFDVRSNVFVATSRGRDDVTGVEVEIVAVLDRSSVPVLIRDLVVR